MRGSVAADGSLLPFERMTLAYERANADLGTVRDYCDVAFVLSDHPSLSQSAASLAIAQLALERLHRAFISASDVPDAADLAVLVERVLVRGRHHRRCEVLGVPLRKRPSFSSDGVNLESSIMPGTGRPLATPMFEQHMSVGPRERV